MAVPNPSEVAPWYLRNITQALELNSATGQVFVRTNAAIVGNVSVGNVAIGSLGNVDLSHTYLPVSVTGNIAGISIPGILGPLSSLFTSNKVESLVYPSDLASNPAMGHAVQFSVYEYKTGPYLGQKHDKEFIND